MLKRSDEIAAMYKELKKHYQVPEVAMVLHAKLQETTKLFSREIVEFLISKKEE